jgi:hypothetical protein
MHICLVHTNRVPSWTGVVIVKARTLAFLVSNKLLVVEVSCLVE